MIEDLTIPELEEAPAYSTRNRKWTDHEIEVLRKYYKRKNTAALAKYLNRSENAVDQKASILGLTVCEEVE